MKWHEKQNNQIGKNPENTIQTGKRVWML